MRLRLLPLALFLLAGVTARADVAALTSISGGTAYQSVDGSANVIGWQFTTTSNITVTNLGLYDPVSYGHPLLSSHQVGLWNSVGTLLASATVTPTGTLIDSSFFTSVAPVNLASGATYTLGALYSLNDFYVSSTTARTFSPGISYVQGVYIDSTTLADPGSAGPTSDGRFGPNFEFTTTAATPEPSSLLLLGTGLVGAMSLARRRLRI